MRIRASSRRRFLQSSAGFAAAGVLGAENARRLVGITVLPEFIQSEGSDAVLRNLIERAGANAVTTSPYVMEPADEKNGSREPPIDAGAGSVRKLDRDLFGKRELWVRTAPSFTPNLERYRGLRYQPPKPDALTEREGAKVAQFIRDAKKAGLKVFLQVQAASPPGYRVQFSGLRDDDQPRLHDGTIPQRRVDKNGSLASPHVIAYAKAMLADLAAQYPEIDGFRVDWPEYPPYFLDALFLDYSDHAQAAAKEMGFDFERMRRDAAALHKKLFGGLRNDDLNADNLDAFPGVRESFAFKAALVALLLREMRDALDEAGAKQMALVPNAFPPPWNIISGFDFAAVAKVAQGASAKLYSMHWAMMMRFYGDALLAANPGLDEARLVKALVRLLDIADDGGLPHLADYHYPEPDEAHPCGSGAMARKIVAARKAAGTMPVYALAHGYGTATDFRRRLEAAHRASPDGFWVNRYGYLSDEKLAVIRSVSSM